MSTYIPSTNEVKAAYIKLETKRNDIRKVEHSDYGQEFDNWLQNERDNSYIAGFNKGSTVKTDIEEGSYE